jgi:riboflavin biosynthesis pyrimidine reductase
LTLEAASPTIVEVPAERFDDFAARRTRRAAAAELPPYATEEACSHAGLVTVGSAWSRALFDGDFHLSPPPDAVRPACCLVFVQSHDGNTGARNPSTLGGGRTDEHLIYEGLSRVAADAVLAGAETVRAGNVVFSVWHPELVALRARLGKPRHPLQVVATLQGLAFDRGILLNTPSVPVAVLTVPACATVMARELAARPWITPVVMDRPEDLPLAFSRLRRMGVERVSAIGGRRIATQLIDAGLVQDLYVTTAPRDGGEPCTPMYPGRLDTRLVVRKRGTGPEAGVVFEHRVLRGRW